jgi:hypothetical protein
VELEAATLHAQRRIAEFSEIITALVKLDYSKRASITEREDAFDGLALFLNILSEELSRRTVSKVYADNIVESMNDLLVVTDARGTITNRQRGGQPPLAISAGRAPRRTSVAAVSEPLCQGAHRL